MRKVKKKKTELVHAIKRIWHETRRGQNIQTQKQEEYILAICGTLFYLDIFDALKKDRQKEYFVKSYLSTYNNKSNLQLSILYEVSADTIGRYCTKHIEIFEECLKIVKELICRFKNLEFKHYLSILVNFLVQNRTI